MKKTSLGTVNCSMLYLISGLFHELSDFDSSSCRDFGGVTIAQTKMISCIFSEHQDGIMLKDLARELGVSPGAASQTLSSLVKTGLIDRCVNENDRRSVIIRPSAAGIEENKRLDSNLGKLVERLFRNVSDDDANVFWRILSGLYSDLKTEKKRLQENREKTSGNGFSVISPENN